MVQVKHLKWFAVSGRVHRRLAETKTEENPNWKSGRADQPGRRYHLDRNDAFSDAGQPKLNRIHTEMWSFMQEKHT